MSQTIDVSGLSPEALRVVESLVALLRRNETDRQNPQPSLFDLIGKAPTLRSSEDIARQVWGERDAWGEP